MLLLTAALPKERVRGGVVEQVPVDRRVNVVKEGDLAHTVHDDVVAHVGVVGLVHTHADGAAVAGRCAVDQLEDLKVVALLVQTGQPLLGQVDP